MQINILWFLQCDWACLNKEPEVGVKPVYAMIMADTHLQGSRNGHWFENWRRDWQMRRGFQTALMLHNPEVVFVLGENINIFVIPACLLLSYLPLSLDTIICNIFSR